jgi:hypothetical protein
MAADGGGRARSLLQPGGLTGRHRPGLTSPLAACARPSPAGCQSTWSCHHRGRSRLRRAWPPLWSSRRSWSWPHSTDGCPAGEWSAPASSGWG